MDDQDRGNARGRSKTATVVWLSAAGVAVLAVGVVIGSRWTATSSADHPTTTTTAAKPPVTSAAEVSTAALRAGVTWLADLAPVDSSSIDDSYVESPWTAAPAQARKVIYTKAVSATGAWCSAAQLTFALDGKYDRLTGQVAIADDSLETKELDFYVLVDGRRAAEIANTGTTPQPVDVAVAGASRLTIGVEPTAADLSECPGPERVGVWADAALTPAGTTPATS